jgi:hypothetical protein
MIKKNYLFKKENNIKLKELKNKRKIKSIVKQSNKQNENQLNPLSFLDKYLLSKNENKDEITPLNFEDDNIFDEDYQEKILNDKEKRDIFHTKLNLNEEDAKYIANETNKSGKKYISKVKNIYKKYIDRIRNDNEIYSKINTDKLPYESDINYYNRISKIRYYAPTTQDLIFETKQKYKKTFKDYLMKLTNNDNLTSDKIMNNNLFIDDNNLIYIVDRLKDFDRELKNKYNNITIKGFIDFSKGFIEEKTKNLLTNDINKIKKSDNTNQDPIEYGDEEKEKKIDEKIEEIKEDEIEEKIEEKKNRKEKIEEEKKRKEKIEEEKKLKKQNSEGIRIEIKKYNKRDTDYTDREKYYKDFLNRVKKEENKNKLFNIFHNINNGKLKSRIHDIYIDDINELVKPKKK